TQLVWPSLMDRSWLRLEDQPSVSAAPRPGANPVPGVIADGLRNKTLASIAGSLRQRGLARDVILACLEVVNAKQCVPPLPFKEVEQIADSISSYSPGPLGHQE